MRWMAMDKKDSADDVDYDGDDGDDGSDDDDGDHDDDHDEGNGHEHNMKSHTFNKQTNKQLGGNVNY